MKLKSIFLVGLFLIAVAGCGNSGPQNVTEGMSETDKEAAVRDYEEQQAALAAKDAKEEAAESE